MSWDRAAFPYLVTVRWAGDAAEPLLVVQSRDQRRMQLLPADPATGQTTLIREDTDPNWLDIVPGVPARTSDGQIAWTADAEGTRRLLLATAGEHRAGTAAPVTPATPAGPGGARHRRQHGAVHRVRRTSRPRSASGLLPGRPGGPGQRADTGPSNSARRAACTAAPGPAAARCWSAGPWPTRADDPDPGARTPETGSQHRVARRAAQRCPPPQPDLFRGRPGQIRTALLLPSWHQPGSARLPVLLDPYGGPHAQRVLATQGAFLTSQWFAEQGFAVVVADGRGTPGRGPGLGPRGLAGDLAAPVLEDQVAALHAAAERCADLDLRRVAIRGWSFGGYLAALAVLRRPDVFHAAIAGAPVTDWRLYDTHYTERYLGHPTEDPAAYEHCSLLGRRAPS